MIDTTSTQIIAEIGINHDGDMSKARALIDGAANAGVWGVKFQYRNVNSLYTESAREIGDEILRKEIERVHLSPEQLLELSDYATSARLKTGISFFTARDVDDFQETIDHFNFLKVPSVELANKALLARLDALGKPTLMSTGANWEKTIASVLEGLDAARWIPLHCISNYPASLVNARLGYISHLRRLWGGPVGYSSHDDYWQTCLLAMQLGAVVIERHITLDRAGQGLDHSSSSTPDEFAIMADFARNLSVIMAGDEPRVPNQGELLNAQNLGRSYYLTRSVAAGEPVTPDALELRCPRTGLALDEAEHVIGKPAVRDVSVGEVLDRSVFTPPLALSDHVLETAKRLNLSIPVRFHDYPMLSARFPIEFFEFHLTFDDVAAPPDLGIVSSDHRFSVHLPDYVSPTLLMDPFSPDEGQSAESHRVLQATAQVAQALEDRTGQRVPIVGSFSVVHDSLTDFHDRHAELTHGFRNRDIEILLQWLPPIAWYFGGAVRLWAMNSEKDIAHIQRNEMPICMDVCHLSMGREFSTLSPDAILKDLAPLIRHVHIADALGHDGEGMPFGEGDPRNLPLIHDAISLGRINVVEVWQGHLNGGEGFAQALAKLAELYGDQ